MPIPPASVPRETQERLDAFTSLLTRWNKALNLVAKGDVGAAVHDRHIPESLALVRHLPMGVKRIIDLGSGGGFPALPLAIATGFHVDLVEADQRKAAFLETALATLGIPGTVWTGRIENCRVPPGRCITARALAPLPELLAYTYPLLEAGGTALLIKGDRLETEMQAAQKTWSMDSDIVALPPKGSRLLKVSRLEPAHDSPR